MPGHKDIHAAFVCLIGYFMFVRLWISQSGFDDERVLGKRLHKAKFPAVSGDAWRQHLGLWTLQIFFSIRIAISDCV